jgi:prevent-host-death family protein
LYGSYQQIERKKAQHVPVLGRDVPAFERTKVLAKAKWVCFIEQAESKGPQTLTKHGVAAAVVVSSSGMEQKDEMYWKSDGPFLPLRRYGT